MRRRKTRYQWLHPIGTIGPAADTLDDHAARELVLNIPNNGTTAISIIDWLPDFGSDELPIVAQSVTLGQFQQNEYFLKRIVGKLFIAQTQNPSVTDTHLATWVGAGFFVARAEDLDAQGDPIGTSVASLQIGNYSPLRAANSREPWIWRRTWILSQQGPTTDGPSAGEKNYPPTNVGYGSVLDGPHIDARTARRVREGERTYFVLAGRSYPPNSANATVGTTVRAWLECRMLGAMRKARGRSAF